MIHAYCPAQPKNHTQEGIMDNRTKLDELLERVLAAQKEFDRLLAEKRQQFSYTLQRGRVIFEQKAQQ